ncbi:hypothetical protein QFC22_003907 [Naganishia vaughanmartiniae]|uniref:Uncharacterized protein n=1 Tax=Naganishia vaughanmartiniae TaxID=1424756 RepID=A0ACC2X477_9TREE|nr:hypothetical protein QFC22_003907 [Naganishia vaughanmartiniae]
MSSVIIHHESTSFLPTPPASQQGRERRKSVSVSHGQPLSELLNKLDTCAIEQAQVAQNLHLVAPTTGNIFLPTPPPSSPRFKSRDDVDSTINEDALLPVASTTATQLIQERIASALQTGSEQAFFVGDLSATYEAVKTWRNSPLGDRVEIFYAVKCNPSPVVLHLLSLMGTSFDCASTAEIDLVLSLPAAPSGDRIIFANPCKPASYIRSAARAGVEMMTFDNADELYKIARHYPNAKLVLRILTDDSKSLCRLGLKYGAPLATCAGLLALAVKLGLNVIGVSFHVGSGCKDPHQFTDAVWRARQVFDMGAKAGFDFTFLDVGGGFERDGFAEMSVVLRDALELYFPREQGVRIVAEPGRFLVSTAFTLATNVIARRRAIGEDDTSEEIQAEVQKEEGEGADVMYYINDGVYGAFNCIMFDHQIVHPYPLTISHSIDSAIPRLPGPPPPNVALPVDLCTSMGYRSQEKASIWGPTCDSIDCVRQVVPLPTGLEVGDWLGWGEMGAYTMCAASKFNGMPLADVYYTDGGDTEDAQAVRQILDGFEV